MNAPAQPVLPSEYDDIIRLLHAQAADPDRIALVFGDQSITYGQLVDQVRRVALQLTQVPVRRGDRVVMLAANSPAYLINYLAVVQAGAVFIPVHLDLAPPEIRYIVGHAEPALVVCPQDLQDKLRAADVDLGPRVVAPDWFEDTTAHPVPSAPHGVDPFERAPDDDVLICYTSGTTSSPKGVVASHRVEIASTSAFGAMWKVSREDTLTVALPLSSLFGLHTAAFQALAHGATVLLLPRFNPVLALEAITARRPTVFLGVPTMYAMMVEHVRQTGRRYDLSSLRLAVASGAALPGTVKAAFQELFGIQIQEYYALSEVRPVFSPDLRTTAPVPVGSSGCLAPRTEARIVGDQGQPVPDGTVGALFLRAPSLMKSYFRDPQRTAAAVKDGWFETGDLVRKEGDFFFLVGRTRDQIICGGSKVSAAEVEDILLKQPGVLAAAVVGVPDEKYGQLVRAVVVRREGAAVTPEDLATHCARHLSPYKVPRGFTFVDELPVGPTGKILKRELEAMLS